MVHQEMFTLFSKGERGQNNRLTYFLSIASYCLSLISASNEKVPWERILGSQTGVLLMLSLVANFFVLLEGSVAKGRHFEFVVSSGNLRLRMRWF